MAKYTKVTTIEELKEIWAEIFFDKTDKVTKISDGSVLNAVAFGCAKLGQKTLKEIALNEARMFPNSAFGSLLDDVAALYGIAPRFTESRSSVYVRLVGAPGTEYFPGVHTFTGRHGVVFDLEQNFTIPSFGFGYAKLRSQTVGSRTNVDPLTIKTVSPVPTGHTYVINEYIATGGRDLEDDILFRRRIREGANIMARATLPYLAQALMKVNPNVLRCFYLGPNDVGKSIIAIASVNGSDFTIAEINEMYLNTEKWFSINELSAYTGMGSGVEYRNITYFPVDVSFRCELESSFNPDVIRSEMQIAYSKRVDYRYWNPGDLIEWDDLLGISKKIKGVKYVFDNYYFLTYYDGSVAIPTHKLDIKTPKNVLPRFQGFQLLNANGQLITDSFLELNPIHYPSAPDASLISTALSTI